MYREVGESCIKKMFTGRAGCQEQYEEGYPYPEMNSNAAMGTFLRKLGNASNLAPSFVQ